MARLFLISFLALAFSVIAFAAPQSASTLGDVRARGVNNCEPVGGTVTISSFNASPNPAVPGGNLFVTLYADTTETIVPYTEATVEVFYGLERLYTDSIKVCDGASVSCPIPPGPFAFTYSIHLPGEISPSQLEILTRGYSPQGSPLFCFEFTPSG